MTMESQRGGNPFKSSVLVLQHTNCETLGTIAYALESAHIFPQYVRPFEGQPIPKGIGDAAGLIVLGGPMGVYDHPRYPFLLDEMHLIERACQEENPVLGVCLGSQLLAAALGATVTKGGGKEIGWHTVTLTKSAASDPLWAGTEPSFTAYHWHGDIFELPRGAVSLASSALTECQGFRFAQNAYGFLFHMEVTVEIVQEMVRIFNDELIEAKVNDNCIVGKMGEHLPSLQRIGEPVFQRWTNLVGGGKGDV